jgi:mannonate dehydratase
MALDDGDMNMFRIVQTLRDVGYDGGLQVDHLPTFAADTPFQGIASGYSVAYIRGLLAALAATPRTSSVGPVT